MASEQFIRLAHTVLRARASPESLAVLLPGNPSYAELAELNLLADRALEEVIGRLKDYPA